MTTTIQFCDGAESQNLTWALSIVNTPTNVSTNPRTGSQCYLLESSDTITFRVTPSGLLSNDVRTTDDHIIFGFGIRITTKPSSASALVGGNDSGGLSFLEIRSNGDLVLVDQSTNDLIIVSDPFELDTWYYIELYFEHTGTADYELKINGISQGSGTTGISDGWIGVADLREINFRSLNSLEWRLDDIYILTDDTSKPAFLGPSEVLAFQAGSGATAAGTLTSGSVANIDDLPHTDAGSDEINLSITNGEWSVECDAAGEGAAGPSGNSDIDGDDNIKMVVWHHQTKRSSGNDPDTLDISYGNDTDTLQYVDYLGILTTGYQDFFHASDDKSTAVPLSTEHIEYGVRKQGSGGKDILCSGIFAQLLHTPPPIFNEIGEGGALAGGEAIVEITPFHEGGALAGGIAEVNSAEAKVPDGGALISGSVIVSENRIALVSSVTKIGPQNGGTTDGIDTTGANLLVIVISEFDGGSQTTPSDSNSNSWTSLTLQDGDSSHCTIFYSDNNPTVGPSHTFTYTGTSTFPVTDVYAFSGVYTFDSFDQESGSFSTSVISDQPGSITPSEDRELLITGMCTHAGTNSHSLDSGFTLQFSVSHDSGINMGGHSGFKIQTTTEAENPTHSWTNAVNTAVIMASFLSDTPTPIGGALAGGVALIEITPFHEGGALAGGIAILSFSNAAIRHSVRKNIIQPSWKQGFARNASESTHPELWKGLIGAWNPGLGMTGSTLHDVSGKDKNGTLINMSPATNWIKSDGRYAIDINGGTEHITISGMPTITTNQLTVSAWVNPDVTSRGDILTRWVTGGTAGDQFDLLYGLDAGKPEFFISDGAFQSSETGPNTMRVGEWHFVVGTYDGADIKVYLNGKEESSTALVTTISTATPPDTIIGDSVNNDGPLNGKVDDIHLYDRALTAKEIRTLYDLKRGGIFQRKFSLNLAAQGLTFIEIAEGGVLVGGLADEFVDNAIGGGVLAGGIADEFIVDDIQAVGGALIGGKAPEEPSIAGGMLIGGLATTRFLNDTATIGTGQGATSRDYSTMTLWEADLDDPQFYVSGVNAVGECYNDSPFDESFTISSGGTIGLATRKLTVAAGEQHDGTAGTGVRIVRTVIGGVSIGIAATTLELLEVDFGGVANATGGIGVSGTIENFIINRVIVHDLKRNNNVIGIGLGVNGATGTQTRAVLNSIVYDVVYNGSFDVGDRSCIGIGHNNNRDSQTINCTIFNIKNNGTGTVNHPALGIDNTNFGSETVRNCISVDIGGTAANLISECYSGAFHIHDHNMATDDTDQGTGSIGADDGVLLTNQFISTIDGSENLHLAVSSDGIDVGDDLRGDYVDIELDIDSQARLNVWSMGADDPSLIFGFGVVAGGVADEFIIDDVQAIGGVLASGVATFEFTEEGLGGILAGGIANANSAEAKITNGGILVGGIADVNSAEAKIPDGGMLVGGDTQTEITPFHEGGVLVGGIVQTEITPFHEGGVLVGGDTQIEITPFHEGGVLVDGIAEEFIDNAIKGGVLVGGIVQIEITPFHEGGTLIDGIASVNSAEKKFPDGGVLAGGLVSDVFFEEGLGGILVGGVVQIEITPFHEGGMLIGGIVDINSAEAFIPAGGTLISGLANVGEIQDEPVAGGALIGGLANVGEIQDEPIAGGMLVGGVGNDGSGFFELGNGGVLAGGIAIVNSAEAIAGIGGILAGGNACEPFPQWSTDIPIALEPTAPFFAEYNAPVDGGALAGGIGFQTYNEVMEGGALVGAVNIWGFGYVMDGGFTVQDSLWGHYPFDEGTGSIANDISGFDYDGTLINMEPSDWIPGKINGALDFNSDDTDDYIDLPLEVLDQADNLTISFWIKTTKTGPQAVLSAANSTNHDEFLIMFNSDTQLTMYNNGSVV